LVQQKLTRLAEKEKTMTDRETNRVAPTPEGAQSQWLGMLQTLAEQIQKQQQNSQQMVQQWMEQAQQQQQTFQQQAQQQQQAFQQMTQEVLSTYTQLFNIPVSYAQEWLRTAQFPIEGYDELTVNEVSGRLSNLLQKNSR
jgi:exonuclease VII large subunit